MPVLILKAELREERARREQAETVMRHLIDGASGLTKKGKRRVGVIPRQVGGVPAQEDEARE
jgi:hypothetical protein